MEKTNVIDGKVQKLSHEVNELRERIENFEDLNVSERASELHKIHAEMLELQYKSLELLLDSFEEVLYDAKKIGIITDVNNVTRRKIEKLHQIVSVELS